MKKTLLTDGNLLVKGEMNDVFKVEISNVRNDMIIDVTLFPNPYTTDNGVEEVELSFDPLNETLIQMLKDEGYMVITEEQVKMIQN